MSEEDKDSKTQDASEYKLRKAKEKGDVPISREVGHLMAYVAIIFAISLVIRTDAPALADSLGDIFIAPQLDLVGTGLEGAGDLRSALSSPLALAATFFAKIMLVLLIGAVVSGILQGPFTVATDRIMPKGSKLNPLKGIRKIAGKDNLVEFLKNLVKLGCISGIAMWFVWGRLDVMLPAGFSEPVGILQILAHDAPKILIAICAFTIPIAILDNVWKRLSFAQKQRMSFKELKDEHKQQEGDPMVKARRMQLARRRMRQSLKTAVPTATIIVTNPTHYAVALRYQRGVDHAPVCVAKGTDLMALRIREIAGEHEIPILENRPLARALHASVDVDEVIPEQHWPLVADLIGYVMALRNRVKRPPPPDTVWQNE